MKSYYFTDAYDLCGIKNDALWLIRQKKVEKTAYGVSGGSEGKWLGISFGNTHVLRIKNLAKKPGAVLCISEGHSLPRHEYLVE